MSDGIPVPIAMVVTCVLSAASLLLGSLAGTNAWKKKAIEHNAAHWVVKTDGSTTFHWNDEKESK